MKAMTIRGLEPETVEILKKKAKVQGKSVNQLVVEIIKNYLGIDRKKYLKEYSDLDHLFGSWSEAEYQRFQEKLAEVRRIDRELWQ